MLLADATGLPDCDALRLLTRAVASEATERGAVAMRAAAAEAAAAAADPDIDAAAQAADKARKHEAEAEAAFAAAAEAAQLHVRLSPEFLEFEENAEEDFAADDARVVRCARLGRALAHQTWPLVTVELVQLDDSMTEDGGSAVLATLLEVCFAAMQDELDVKQIAPLLLDRRCTFDLRRCGAFLDVRDARRVARAAPPHVRLFFGKVTIFRPEDVDALPGALLLGRVAGATVALCTDEQLEPAPMSRVFMALSAAAIGDYTDFALDFGDHLISAADDEHVFNSLRGMKTLRGLHAYIGEDSMAKLLAVLPLSLRRLGLRGRCATDASPLLVAALRAGQLASLDCLVLHVATLKDRETAHLFAEFLRDRVAPFTFCCSAEQDVRTWEVLTALMKSDPASGVPRVAASKLLGFNGPLPVTEIPELVAAIFAALRQESETSVLDDDAPSRPICCLRCQRAGSSAFAWLLLHLHNRAPAEIAALFSSPQHVQLIASRVLRARSPLACSDDRMFAPLLHRMLLIGAADDTAAFPVSTLSAVAAACIRDPPDESSDEPERIYECRTSLLTMLLACAKAGKAFTEDPAFGGVKQWLTHHASWICEAVPRICVQVADAGDEGQSFLLLTNELGVALIYRASDCAQLFWALSRIQSLCNTLWRELALDYERYFESEWLSALIADSVAQLKLFDALERLLYAAPAEALLDLIVREKLYGATCGALNLFNVDALRSHLDILKQRRDTAEVNSPAAAAIDVAHTHVASILRIVQNVHASPAAASMLLCLAKVNIMRTVPAEPGALDSATRDLNCELLQWMRDGTLNAVRNGLLSHVLNACTAILPADWTSRDPPMTLLAHTTLMACCLQLRDSPQFHPPENVFAWVYQDISALLTSIHMKLASAIAGDRGSESFHSIALLLYAVGTVFGRCPAAEVGSHCGGDFRLLATQLAAAGWLRTETCISPSAHTPGFISRPYFNAAQTAETAYVGLARLLRHVPPEALSARSLGCAAGGAAAVLGRLGDELQHLAQLRSCLDAWYKDQVKPCQIYDHRGDAHANFSKVLRRLRPLLQPIGNAQLSPNALAALTVAVSPDE